MPLGQVLSWMWRAAIASWALAPRPAASAAANALAENCTAAEAAAPPRRTRASPFLLQLHTGRSARRAVACGQVCQGQAKREEAGRHVSNGSMAASGEGDKVAMNRVTWILLSGFAEHGGAHFQERIIPSAETWLSEASDVFAVVGDGTPTRDRLRDMGCSMSKTAEEITEMVCPTRGAKVTVLLVPCDDWGHSGHYEDSTCCKYDRALSYLGKSSSVQGKDWVYIGDDDMYLRTDVVLRFLARYDASAPLLLNADGDEVAGPKLRQWNADINQCNDLIPQGFFYTMISKELMGRLLPSIDQGGVSAVCKSTRGSYDTTVGLWAWRYGAKFVPTRPYSLQCLGDVTTCNDKDLPKATLFNHGVRSVAEFAKWHARWGHADAPPQTFQPQGVERDFEGDADPCARLFV